MQGRVLTQEFRQAVFGPDRATLLTSALPATAAADEAAHRDIRIWLRHPVS